MYPLLNKLKYFGIFDLHFNIFYILIKLYFLNKKTLTSFLIQDNVLYVQMLIIIILDSQNLKN